MLQIYTPEECPKWIKEKCESGISTKNPETHKIVKYGCFDIEKQDEVVRAFYYVKSSDVGDFYLHSICHDLYNSIL